VCRPPVQSTHSTQMVGSVTCGPDCVPINRNAHATRSPHRCLSDLVIVIVIVIVIVLIRVPLLVLIKIIIIILILILISSLALRRRLSPDARRRFKAPLESSP
jgi:heme A synthase